MFISAWLLCLQRKPRKCFERHLLADSESASHSARAAVSVLCRFFFMYSFTKLKEDHYVFVSNFEIIQSNLLKTAHIACMEHLCLNHDYNAVVASNFKWKEHRQSLILFIWRYLFYLCYLFYLGIVLKFQFSFFFFTFRLYLHSVI